MGLGIALAVAALASLVVAIKVGWTSFGQSLATKAYNYVGWLLAVMTVITGWAHGPSYLKQLKQQGRRLLYAYVGPHRPLSMR
jgi:hypothetical protein